MGTVPMNKGTIDPPEVAAIKIAKWRESGLIPPPKQSKESMNKKGASSETQADNPPVVKPVITHALGMPRRFSSGLGDCLKQKFETYKVKQKPGCSCKDIQKTLNSMTAEEIEKDISLYVDNIFENVQNLSGLVGTAIKVFSWVSPDSAKSRIRELLLECLESAKAPELHTESLDSKDGSEHVQQIGSP